MAGKYDGRKANGGKRNYERKPLGSKYLTRNMAADLFRTWNVKATLTELLASENERLRFDVLCYVWDRLEGKPFTASNPNEVKQPNVLLQDNRLQIAVKNLLPQVKPKQKRRVLHSPPDVESKALTGEVIPSSSHETVSGDK